MRLAPGRRRPVNGLRRPRTAHGQPGRVGTDRAGSRRLRPGPPGENVPLTISAGEAWAPRPPRSEHVRRGPHRTRYGPSAGSIPESGSEPGPVAPRTEPHVPHRWPHTTRPMRRMTYRARLPPAGARQRRSGRGRSRVHRRCRTDRPRCTRRSAVGCP